MQISGTGSAERPTERSAPSAMWMPLGLGYIEAAGALYSVIWVGDCCLLGLVVGTGPGVVTRDKACGGEIKWQHVDKPTGIVEKPERCLVLIDPDGRYVVESGFLDSRALSIINVYAPKLDDPTFFGKLIRAAMGYLDTKVIMAGDLNCLLSGKVDHEPPKTDTNLGMIEALKVVMHGLGLQDI
ncbi:hypothetical protein NDU88_006129 [Pleurodeles waltl]|uniref:Endonuclease/exonuclease/phosphatase domain-containing protein n=1 Tax=Pleurodeles waltl TaxID=8319 RepID=A0AAV7WDT6_PLEWA|nr:hypothetical protein NDU88_006129 [Pleurodeles waltl]